MRPILLTLAILLTAPRVWPQTLQIKLPEPVWELDADSRPLTEREAALAPKEQDIALELRPLLRDNRHDEALAILEKADQSRFSAALHFVAGQLYLATGDFDNAADAYRNTLAQMPDFLRAHRGLGLIHLQQENFFQAREHLTRAIALGANDAQIYGQLSYINLQRKQPWSAISGYRQALFLEPDNTQWQQGLLYALIDAGDYPAALALLEELLEQQPDNAELWLQQSNLAMNTGDDLGALSSLEMAIRMGDDNPNHRLIAGRLHLQSGSLDRGIALLDDVAGTADPAMVEQLLGALAWLEQRGQWAHLRNLVDALQKYTGILHDHQHSRLLVAQSGLQQRDKQATAAAATLEQALDLDPGNGPALLKLAGLLGESNPGRATMLLVRAQAIKEFRERALIEHARLAINQQFHDEALELLLNVVEENPHRADVNDSIASLQRILAGRQGGDL